MDDHGVRTQVLRAPPWPDPVTIVALAVAVTPQGEGIVAWPEDSTDHDTHSGRSSHSGRVLAASVAADGGWRVPEVVWSSREDAPGESLGLAVGPSGEAALTWSEVSPLLAVHAAGSG